MKRAVIILVILVGTASANAQLQVTAPGVKWEPAYHFDKCNSFQMDFFAKGNELMRTMEYRTYYQSNGVNFLVRLMAKNKGNGMETIMDLKNQVAIQIMGTGGSTEPYYNAGGYKMPASEELKKLEILPTDETRTILGLDCRKYTYTHKKIFGEVWITEQVDMSNDLGIFRAAKMAALHNTLSVGGFVMEMTSEDAKGGKTVMKTIQLNQDEKIEIDLKNVKMNTAINKVNYFVF